MRTNWKEMALEVMEMNGVKCHNSLAYARVGNVCTFNYRDTQILYVRLAHNLKESVVEIEIDTRVVDVSQGMTGFEVWNKMITNLEIREKLIIFLGELE